VFRPLITTLILPVLVASVGKSWRGAVMVRPAASAAALASRRAWAVTKFGAQLRNNNRLTLMNLHPSSISTYGGGLLPIAKFSDSSIGSHVT
jgi:hypothetical protein